MANPAKATTKKVTKQVTNTAPSSDTKHDFVKNVDKAFMDFSLELGALMHNEMVDWSPELKIKWNKLYIKVQELKQGAPITGNVTINTK